MTWKGGWRTGVITKTHNLRVSPPPPPEDLWQGHGLFQRGYSWTVSCFQAVGHGLSADGSSGAQCQSCEDGWDSQGLKKGPQQLVDRRMGRVEDGVALPPF